MMLILIQLIVLAGILLIDLIWAKTLLLLVYLGIQSIMYTLALYKDYRLIIAKSITSLAVVISLIIMPLVLFFYIWKINTLSVAVSFLFPAVLLLLIRYKNKNKAMPPLLEKIKKEVSLGNTAYIYLIFFILFSVFFIYQAYKRSMQEPVTSIWEVFSPLYLAFVFLSVISLILFIVKSKKITSIHIMSLSILLFSIFVTAAAVFNINFGFDPFVHQASERYILDTQTISPKPILYIGHWLLSVSLSLLSGIDLIYIDKYIVPVFASIFIPAFIFFALIKFFKKEKNILISIIAIPVFLFPFYFSVPQNTSLVFVIMTISSLYIWQSKKLTALFFISTSLVHLFSGIALAIVGITHTILNQKYIKKIISTYKKQILYIIWLGAVFSGLYIFSDINLYNLKQNIEIESIGVAGIYILKYLSFYSVYHAVYLLLLNNNIIVLLLISLYLLFFIKTKNKDNYFPSIIITFTILVASNILWPYIKLPFLSYEIYDFIWRIWFISLSLILIHLTGSIYMVVSKINSYIGRYSGFVYIIILSAVVASSTYLLYPRNDGLVKSRLYSTSRYDIQAVEWIEKDSKGKDYIVLANQAVSAAALHKYGFKKYYQICDQGKCTQIFYYPIPTISPLYKTYLDMVYKGPDLKYIQGIKQDLKIDKIYFVVNDYWTDSQKIIKKAKKMFASYKAISDGKVYIFKTE